MRIGTAVGKPAATPFREGRRAVRHAGGGIRPGLFYGIFTLLCATNVVTLVGLLMAPDIAVLLSGQNDLVLAAYEDRLAELRTEVDRLHSRQYARTGSLNLQLQELTQQQDLLLEQHQYVRQLATQAAELGIQTAGLPPAGEPDAPTAGLRLGDAASRIEAVGAEVREMMGDSRLALAGLSEAAAESTETILAELRGVGITPDLPPQTGGIGGPLLPARDEPALPGLLDEANAAMVALMRYEAARDAIAPAPIHWPLAVDAPRSSNFGNRRDPFTRRSAFHAGIDFAAPRGTKVLSAGRGTVTFAGPRSGYGNVVEVRHGDGLVSRYAHLSAFLVEAGEEVRTGTPIARVGSTGRSTGPHLHFEMRRKDVPIDPSGFLAAGRRLQRYLPG